ncbi:MAG TPA: class I SAM-dependent methyltransferase [Ardenticatenaceae bacterium]|nr:class I SAM-dependent methyltransferase [Ardenticatenaceae bacterium]
MADGPETWHYGVVAQWWAEFNLEGPEIAYFQGIIERCGQPALDVACGTGRLLLPYLRAGLDVDGSDVSPDMLALCREKATREGLPVRLYQQATHELDLPRRYRTIIMCGSFGIGGSRRNDMQALQRIYEHLEPGGTLAFDHELPYSNGESSWHYWLPGKRRELPQEWEAPGGRRPASDGTAYSLRSRIVDLDPFEQILTLGILAEHWRGEEQIAREERLLKSCLYFKNEIVMMLEGAGFGDVAVYAAYAGEEATAEHGDVVVVARKPG